MYSDKKITVIIPCLNEEKGIEEILTKMPCFVDEVIIVDNNSTDRTAEIAKRLKAKVVFEKERGYGRAYKTGFLQAQGDIILTLDGDHSYPVEAISYLIDIFITKKTHFLSASRFPIENKEAMSLKHYIGNKILSWTMSILFLKRVRDSQSGMWVFYKDILSKVRLESDGMTFSEEIKIEAIRAKDINFCEVPIDFSQRSGESKLHPWKDGINNMLFLFKKRFLG